MNWLRRNVLKCSTCCYIELGRYYAYCELNKGAIPKNKSKCSKYLRGCPLSLNGNTLSHGESKYIWRNLWNERWEEFQKKWWAEHVLN